MAITGTINIDGKSYTFTAVPEGETAGRRHDQREAPAASGGLPDLPDEYSTQVVRIERAGKKNGTSPRGKWTRTWGKDGLEEDSFYATMDTKLGAELERMARESKEVRIAYITTDYGREFVGYPAGTRETAQPSARQAEKPTPTPPTSARAEEFDPDGDRLPM